MRAGDGNDLVYAGIGSDDVAGGNGNDHIYGGSDGDRLSGGNGDDRISGNPGDDVVYGGPGNDTLFRGWGADRLYGGQRNDVLHALAPDGQPDLLDCGPGHDTAYVLRSERARTQLRGCETVVLVDTLTPDQSEGENSVGDAEANG